jgi:hypothetical protein
MLKVSRLGKRYCLETGANLGRVEILALRVLK